MVGRATEQVWGSAHAGHQYEKMLRSIFGWVWANNNKPRTAVTRLMARRRRRGKTNYKQIKTGTVNLGTGGAQIHIAEIKMIDDALKGSYLNNVQFAVQQQLTIGSGTQTGFQVDKAF